MSPSPFEHGLALAWSDGALSRRGAQLLELLQTRFGLNDDSRADIEEIWQESLVNLNRRSFGDGDENLSSWLEALKDTGSKSASLDLFGAKHIRLLKVLTSAMLLLQVHGWKRVLRRLILGPKHSIPSH